MTQRTTRKTFNSKQGISPNRLRWYNIDLRYFPRSIEVALQKSVEQFFEGDFPKKTLFQRLFPLAISVYATLVFIAYMLYPSTYYFDTNTISDLGNPIYNPSGYAFFSAAFIYLSIILIPFYQFVHRGLEPLGTLLSKLGLISNIVGSASFIVLALFPNTPNTINVHIPAAVASFGSMVFSGIFYWIVIIKDAIIKSGTRRVIVWFGVATNVIVGIAVAQLIDPVTFTFKNIWPGTAFWEWTLFFSIGIDIVLLFNSVPEIKKKQIFYRVVKGSGVGQFENVCIYPINKLPEDAQLDENGQSILRREKSTRTQ
nr:DUF998 domain-containing protein [Candidatus Sigynarchaeota archaeon]